MSEINGYNHELSRTPSYMVFSHRRGSALFAQLLAERQRAERLARRNDSLRERLDIESNLLVLALHELALAQKKEPQLFIRKWLTDHRDLSALQREEARLG